MLDISERQKFILESLVDEYIKTAFPISSDFLKCHCNLGVSPATIRLDLAQLTDSGFLEKTHISGGRVPTDKGYRFFVDSLSGERKEGSEKESREEQKKTKTDKRGKNTDILIAFLAEFGFDSVELPHFLAKELAEFSSNLSLAAVDGNGFHEHLFWKEGLKEAVKAPEFKDINYFKSFLEAIDEFEQNVDDFVLNQEIEVLIGRESPLSQKDFSLVISRVPFAGKIRQKTTLAILGPKRMDFRKNIALINNFIETLEDFSF